MSTARELGLALGRAIAARTKPAPAPTVIPAPVVHAADNNIAVTVDAQPIADAVAALHFPEPLAVDLVQPAQMVVDAIDRIEGVDLVPIADQVAQIAQAIGGLDFPAVDFSTLVAAIDRNTAAVELLAKATDAQTGVLGRGKQVEYDNQGRVSRIKVDKT